MAIRHAEPAQAEPARFITIDGRRAQVVEVRSALPPRLDALLRTIRVVIRNPVPRFGGFAAVCADQDHQLVPWITGTAYGLELRLSACVHCETVEVRDTSIDSRAGLPTGGQALRRRDTILGWY